MDEPGKEQNQNIDKPMPMRLLGRTGLMVSSMGLGGMGVMDERHEDLDSRIEIINTALDNGINFIDTARGYFDSEEIIGHVLKKRRNDAYIATKTYLRSAKGTEKELLESLEKLQVKKIDLYQIHHIQYMKEFEKIMEPGGAMEVVKSYQKQGVIDFIGVSSHNPHILPEILESDLFDTVQFPFSVVEREHYDNIKDVVKQQKYRHHHHETPGGGQCEECGFCPEISAESRCFHYYSRVFHGGAGYVECEYCEEFHRHYR